MKAYDKDGNEYRIEMRRDPTERVNWSGGAWSAVYVELDPGPLKITAQRVYKIEGGGEVLGGNHSAEVKDPIEKKLTLNVGRKKIELVMSELFRLSPFWNARR